MVDDKDKKRQSGQQETEPAGSSKEQQHSSAFNETDRGNEKSTVNPEEEADLEQQRKDALRERD